MRQANRFTLFITLWMLAACHAPSADSAQSGANIPAAASAANPDIPLKADLPIFWQGVPDLLHPIVVSAADEYAEKSYSSKTVKSHIDVSDYELSGNLFNLVFENVETGAKQPLFPHNNQMILHAKYLISQPENNTHQNAASSSAAPRFYRHFIYQVREEADREDAPLSLYLSDEHGQNRQKLHPNGEFVIGTRWLPETDRYYFTTKSDSNGDGKIGLADQSHNYYIDFKEIDHPKVHAYDLMPK